VQEKQAQMKFRDKGAGCLQRVSKVLASDAYAVLLAVGFPRQDECKLGYPARPIR
jgi:hypothetical protein